MRPGQLPQKDQKPRFQPGVPAKNSIDHKERPIHRGVKESRELLSRCGLQSIPTKAPVPRQNLVRSHRTPPGRSSPATHADWPSIPTTPSLPQENPLGCVTCILKRAAARVAVVKPPSHQWLSCDRMRRDRIVGFTEAEHYQMFLEGFEFGTSAWPDRLDLVRWAGYETAFPITGGMARCSRNHMGNASGCWLTPSRRRTPSCPMARCLLECKIAVANEPAGYVLPWLRMQKWKS